MCVYVCVHVCIYIYREREIHMEIERDGATERQRDLS